MRSKPMDMVQPKEKATVEEVMAFARKMRVAADNKKTKCVDGGYRANEAVGAIAFPGGHLGLSMNLLSFGVDPTTAFKVVHEFATKTEMPYSWHTDSHEGHDGVVVGCGHCNAALKEQNETAYHLDSTQVAQLLEQVRNAQENETNMEMIVLKRDHTEKAILVVTSTDFTVKPWDQEDNVQYFIYDKTRHEALVTALAEFLVEKGVRAADGSPITTEQLLEAFTTQLNATLGLLATSRGAQLFTVDVSSPEPVVAEVGVAPILV